MTVFPFKKMLYIFLPWLHTNYIILVKQKGKTIKANAEWKTYKANSSELSHDKSKINKTEGESYPHMGARYWQW